MFHDKTTRTVSSLLVLWDGAALIDATGPGGTGGPARLGGDPQTPGYADNEALATELLGFRPTRHAPLGAGATLYTQALGPDPSDDEDDEDLPPR
jgi:hypothetical protein